MARRGSGTAPRRGGERGAVAIMIALLVVVIVGLAALAVDSGVIFQEKRELQTGAEAAALAIAQDCATGDCGNYEDTAATYADANATDGAARIVEITFPDSNTVTVATGSRNGSGGDRDGDPDTVDTYFAPVLGVSGVDVAASASASWGTVGGSTTLPLIFGLCELGRAVGPGDPPVLPSPSFTIGFHTGSGGDDGDCLFNPAGQDVDEEAEGTPGGFGWLTNGCQAASLSVGMWVPDNPGVNTPNCNPEDLGLVVGELILVPIFDDISDDRPDCAGRCYHVYAFAGLRIEGFRFIGGGGAWRGSGETGCTGPDSCITGHVESILETGAATGGPNLGAFTIQLVG